MRTKMLSVIAGLVVLCGMAGSAVADVEAQFDYGCEPRRSWCDDLTCTFDGSASTAAEGNITGYQWYFRRYLGEDRESETATRAGMRVTHTYTQTRCRNYTYYATLEVTDSLGNKHSHTERVDPARRLDSPPENQRPIADFSASCTFLDCVFNARASYDPDGDIVSYRWNFGDGHTGSGDTVPHRYAASGSYLVSLTVADNAGATGSRSRTISVTAEPPPGFNLTATKSLARGGRHRVHLRWTGATSRHVDVYRNSRLIITTPNDGAYTNGTGRRGRATYTYWVCERRTSTCSNAATVAFR